MNLNANTIAGFIGGKIFGDPSVVISNLAKIEEAAEGDLTFLYLPAYEKYHPTTKASAILVKPGFNKTRKDITYIEVNDPNKAFARLLIRFFSPVTELSGIDESASIDSSASVGDNTALGKNVVICANCKIGSNVKIFHNTVIMKDVQVGDNCLIYPNVCLREGIKIGNNVIIHAGSIIGADGFGYYKDEENLYHKIPQIGKVIIEDDVEIGANVTIDRAAIGATVIKSGVKIDNLVQIAHNVVIGKNTVISSQTGISGSTKIGENCILAGQVGLVGHIEIADNVILMAQSGISKSIKKPGMYFGYPAKEHKTALKLEAHFRNLPDYVKRIEELEKKIAELQAKIR
ncbi:MAG: UDP-3-O-(3-hydroxymyristoyl)glucosamine N-acyltransferase [Ignavibacteriaceae bacterium]